MVAPFKCDEKVTIERLVDTAPSYGAPGDTWEPVAARIWANVQDVLPSRGGAESTADGLRVGIQRSRLRIRNNSTITATMRVTLHGHSDRVMQIIAGPSLMDDRVHTEFILESYSS
jgi:head-tail adaptor